MDMRHFRFDGHGDMSRIDDWIMLQFDILEEGDEIAGEVPSGVHRRTVVK